MRLTRAVHLIAVVALTAAACGSTVPVRQQQAAEQAAGGGLAAPAGGVGDTSGLGGSGELGTGGIGGGGVSSSSGGVAGGSTGAIGGTSGVAGGTGGTGATGGSGGAGVSGQGVTANTISLGLLVARDVSAANQALGAGSATGIDQKRAWEALIEDINKRGGIAGRKVEPVFHEYSATSDKTLDQIAEDACANWTEDNKVFAGIGNLETEVFQRCMQEGGAALINQTTIRVYYDERLFPKYPTFVAPMSIDMNSQSAALANGLAKQGYFGKNMKLGLVTFDDPNFAYATKTSLIPALRRHGVKLTDIARAHMPANDAELAQTSNDLQNAAIKFKTEGITHVMLHDLGGAISIFFMQHAEKQQYRPRYGLTSQSGGTVLAGVLGPDADNQLNGARGIGWVPVADLAAADDPHSKGPKNRQRCIALMQKAGVEMSSRNAEGTAIQLCDGFWFTEAAIEAGGRTINLESFVGGLNRLGRGGYQPGMTFMTRVSDDVRDGGGAVANVSYFAECDCFRYTSRPYAISD